MSITRMCEIWCDGTRPSGEKCWKALGDYGTAELVRRRLAKHEGWAVNLPGGRDLCDECKESNR